VPLEFEQQPEAVTLPAQDLEVFWVIAIAPLTSLLVLLAIRWEPSGYDIDGEDYRDALADANIGQRISA